MSPASRSSMGPAAVPGGDRMVVDGVEVLLRPAAAGAPPAPDARPRTALPATRPYPPVPKPAAARPRLALTAGVAAGLAAAGLGTLAGTWPGDRANTADLARWADPARVAAMVPAHADALPLSPARARGPAMRSPRTTPALMLDWSAEQPVVALDRHQATR